MAKSHKIEYDVGSNPEGTSSQQVNDVYYDDSGTPVPQIQTTDLGKVLTAGANDPVWAEGEGGGTWGEITGDLEDQTDLITILDEHGQDIDNLKGYCVTKNTAQTITAKKSFADSVANPHTSSIDNESVFLKETKTGNTFYETRVQDDSVRCVYDDGSGSPNYGNWSGYRLSAPTAPATDPRSKLYHYVTRNGTQQTYTIQLPEGSGTLALADGEWTLKYDWDLAAIQAGEKDVDFTGCDEMFIVTHLQSASVSTNLYGRFVYNTNATFNTLMIYSTTGANTKYKNFITHWIDQGILLECTSSRYREADSQAPSIFSTGSTGSGYSVYGLSLSQLKKLYIDTPESLSFGNIKIYAR